MKCLISKVWFNCIIVGENVVVFFKGKLFYSMEIIHRFLFDRQVDLFDFKMYFSNQQILTWKMRLPSWMRVPVLFSSMKTLFPAWT